MSKIVLTAQRRPLLAANMTRTELIKEAEHTFPHPTRLVALMIAHLRGHADGHGCFTAHDPAEPTTHGVNCPSCGAPLQAEIEE